MGSPTKSEIEKTNIYRMMQELHIDSYADFHAWSVDNREKFWKKSIDLLNIAFKKPFTQIVDLSRGAEDPNWLVGAKLNIADSCKRNRSYFSKRGGIPSNLELRGTQSFKQPRCQRAYQSRFSSRRSHCDRYDNDCRSRGDLFGNRQSWLCCRFDRR